MIHIYSSLSTGPSLRNPSDEVELSLDLRGFFAGSTSPDGDCNVAAFGDVGGDAGVD